MALLTMETQDGWTTEHSDVESVRIETAQLDAVFSASMLSAEATARD
jgi:hypothetical protein